MSEVKRYIAYQLYDAAKNLEPLPEGRTQVVLATTYDAETARADKAEADRDAWKHTAAAQPPVVVDEVLEPNERYTNRTGDRVRVVVWKV